MSFQPWLGGLTTRDDWVLEPIKKIRDYFILRMTTVAALSQPVAALSFGPCYAIENGKHVSILAGAR